MVRIECGSVSVLSLTLALFFALNVVHLYIPLAHLHFLMAVLWYTITKCYDCVDFVRIVRASSFPFLCIVRFLLYRSFSFFLFFFFNHALVVYVCERACFRCQVYNVSQCYRKETKTTIQAITTTKPRNITVSCYVSSCVILFSFFVK